MAGKTKLHGCTKNKHNSKAAPVRLRFSVNREPHGCLQSWLMTTPIYKLSIIFIIRADCLYHELLADQLKSEIQAANMKFMEAFAKLDSKAVGALYTSDCKVMPTGADVVTGPDGKFTVATMLKIEKV